ncbi:ATP-binding cassette domain-containing protein [Ureibacillus composti]|nr:ATP-binding cassette domain-containing protein [Ureibacillus composti]
MIKVHNLTGGYTHSPIIQGLDLEIRRGEFFALLGPNGSGKTTLFKLITGQLQKKSGNILLDGKEISTYSKLAKAKKVAVLSQEASVSFDYTVEEIVSLGRYPHQKGILKNLSKEDRKIIEEVMAITKVSAFRKKQFRMISGGEKQRVLLAKALAQEPELLLLDEPTNHLDIKHTFQLLDLLKERQQTMGLTVFAILHDLNVASLYADRFALLHDGRLLEVGDVELLRKVDQLEKVYQVQVNAQSHPTVPKPQLLMTPNYALTMEHSKFRMSFDMTQTDHVIHVQFKNALRTISNCDLGDGIQWLTHFSHVYNPENLSGLDIKAELIKWMETNAIPYEQAAGIVISGKPGKTIIIIEEICNIEMMIFVSVGNGNAGKSTSGSGSNDAYTINTMLFMDAHFTDGALINGSMLATEAKMKALEDLGVVGFASSKDTLLLGLTQQGEKITTADSRTDIGKAIGQLVFRATQEVIKKHLHLGTKKNSN